MGVKSCARQREGSAPVVSQAALPLLRHGGVDYRALKAGLRFSA